MPAKLPALIGASMGLMLLPLISVPSANAASFNCSKASNIVETLICSDPNLSQLDEKMDAAYSVARAQSQNQQQLLQDQRAWVATRNQCQTAKCVSDAYNQRLAALSGQPRAGGTALDTSQTAMTTAAVSASAAPSAVYATTPDGKKIQSVMADGMGSTIESALQNAAENALKNVVGSFVTSEKMAERYSQISEGVRSETKKLSSQTHEYSQGSIQSIDIVDSHQDGAIFRVTAKVAVRIEDFRELMAKAVEGETKISKGLFAQAATADAQAATAQKQSEDASAIFVDRILRPIAENAGVTMTVGEPIRYKTRDDAGPASRPDALAIETKVPRWSNPTVFPVHLAISAGVPQEIQKAAATLANNNCAPISKLSYDQNPYADSSFRDYVQRRFGDGFFNRAPPTKVRIFVALSIGSSDKFMVCGFDVSYTAQDFSQYMKMWNPLKHVELNIFDGGQNLIFSESSGSNDPLILVNFKALRFPASPKYSWAVGGGVILLYADFPSDQFNLVVDIPSATLKDADHATVKFTQ